MQGYIWPYRRYQHCDLSRSCNGAGWVTDYEGEPVSDFYGNWNHVEGYSDGGYYLGREFILYLEGLGLGVREVGTLPIEKIKQHAESFLSG